MPIVYLSLGSNLGKRDQNLACAIISLEGADLRVVRVSSIYETVAVGIADMNAPDYLNCVAEAETSLAPGALLDYTQAVERRCGRTPTFHWGPRVIDIDIVWYEGVALKTEQLTIPHERSQDRAFVLVPLAELAPNLDLGAGVAVSQLLSRDEIKSQQIKRWPN